MDKKIQQAMLPGSTAWFLEKKPVRILNIISIIMAVIFLAFVFLAIVDDSVFDNMNGTHALFIFIFVFVWMTVAIIASIRVSHDKAIYIKENGYIFKVVPMSGSGSGAMYGGIAGGLIGAAIGTAIDNASNNSAGAGAGVFGMVHTGIGAVSQISGISQVEDKDDVYIVTATLTQHLKGGKTTNPKKQKLQISKKTLAVDNLMAELNTIR